MSIYKCSPPKSKKGVDFQGYRSGAASPDFVALSQTSITVFANVCNGFMSNEFKRLVLRGTVKQWCRWARSGLGHLTVEIPDILFLTLINNPDDLELRSL